MKYPQLNPDAEESDDHWFARMEKEKPIMNFIVSFCAMMGNQPDHFPAFLTAKDESELVHKINAILDEYFPKSAGWANHSISSEEIKFDRTGRDTVQVYKVQP